MRYETNSRKLIRLMEQRGWRLTDTVGSHHHFVHPEHPGRVTVPHPKKDLPLGLVRAIYRQAHLDEA